VDWRVTRKQILNMSRFTERPPRSIFQMGGACMDKIEGAAANFLRTLGYRDIIHEPDGNPSPDFLIDHRIAIEVRSFYRNRADGQAIEGLEEQTTNLWRNFEKLVLSFERKGPPQSSWFVFYSFDHPLSRWRKLQPKIQQALQSFAGHLPSHNRHEILIERNFRLQLIRANQPHDSLFVMGGHPDEEAGAFADPAMAKWIQLHDAEKIERVRTFRNRYPEWWLIFVDDVDSKWGDVHPGMFRTGSNSEEWHKIIVIHPNDTSRYLDIHPVTGVSTAIPLG
jgi:hypothetical protein